MAVETKDTARRKPSFLSLHDQELLAAKNSGKKVRMVLAADTYFTDDEATVVCQIEKVDRYAIKIKTARALSLWLMKQCIFSTEVICDV